MYANNTTLYEVRGEQVIDCEGNNNLQNIESKRGKAGVTPDKEPDSNRARDSKGY